MGARKNFFPQEAKPRELAKMVYFSARQRREQNFSRFLRCFRLNLRACDASAEGTSENFRVFCTDTAYDVIIFKFQEGGGQLLQVAPPPGAYVLYNYILDSQSGQHSPSKTK